jgi:hypothetical protein
MALASGVVSAQRPGALLGEDLEVISKDKRYRCLDQLLPPKKERFSSLIQRWTTLFQARFDILLYDLTSTYFESDPPGVGKRQFGYSRDKGSDCVPSGCHQFFLTTGPFLIIYF